MLSRVAEAIYWMSRYAERAENIARFIEVNLNLMLDMPEGLGAQWEPLVATTGDIEVFRARYKEGSAHNVIHFLTVDPDYPNSILNCLRCARENARSVREVISSEMWEAINRFYLTVNQAAQSSKVVDNAQEFFAEVKHASHVFSGSADTTMPHGEGWHFNRLGRMTERADKTSRILDLKYYYLLPSVSDVGTPVDDIQWTAVLRSVGALEAYRQRYRRIQPPNAISYLVFDREFPRTILFCLTRAEDSLRRITGSSPGTHQNAAERELGRLTAEISYLRAEDIIKFGLHEFLDDLQLKLNDVGGAIYDTYFALKPMHASIG